MTLKKVQKIFLSVSGVTLPELMVGLMIFTILMGGIYTTLVGGTNTWAVNRTKMEIQQDLRFAVDRMKEDLRKASISSIQDVPANGVAYSTITFRIPESINADGSITWPSETVQYLISSGTLVRQIEDSSVIQEQRTVAENITSLQITRQSSAPEIIQINMQSSKSVNASNSVSTNTSVKVRLRN